MDHPVLPSVFLTLTFLQHFSKVFQKLLQNFSIIRNFTKNFRILTSVRQFSSKVFFKISSKPNLREVNIHYFPLNNSFMKVSVSPIRWKQNPPMYQTPQKNNALPPPLPNPKNLSSCKSNPLPFSPFIMPYRVSPRFRITKIQFFEVLIVTDQKFYKIPPSSHDPPWPENGGRKKVPHHRALNFENTGKRATKVISD